MPGADYDSRHETTLDGREFSVFVREEISEGTCPACGSDGENFAYQVTEILEGYRNISLRSRVGKRVAEKTLVDLPKFDCAIEGCQFNQLTLLTEQST